MKEVDMVMLGRGWNDCPFTVETWTCNNGYALIGEAASKLSKNFLMHKQVYIPNSYGRAPVFNFDHMQSLSEKYGFTVVTQHNISELKNAEKYPFHEICRKFKTTYFASTHCYMIAYALYHGYEKIRLYGWDFAKEVSKFEDDLWERCGTEYWIGRAEGMGVAVENRTSHTLLATKDDKPYAIDG